MKELFLLLSFLFLTIVTYGQDYKSCSKFKIGRFEVANTDGSKSVITRTKKYQIEESEGVKTKDKIVWINDCTYKLIPISIYDETNTIGTDILVFTFIETSEHWYTIKVSRLSDPNIYTISKVYEYGYLK